MPQAAARKSRKFGYDEGDYFTDSRRLLRVEKIDGEIVMCEDAGDPTVTVEVSLDDLKEMRRVEIDPDGV